MQNKAILLFLVALNLCLCALVFVETRQVKQTRKVNDIMRKEAESKSTAIEIAYSSLLSRNNDELINDLRVLGLIHSLKNNELYLFIPKSPCDVCLNNELDYIMEHRIGITILAPDYRGKALRAKFSKADNIRVETYISDTIASENTVAREDNLFYFTVKDDKVSDYYPVNKYYPAARQVFFNYLQTL